MTDSTWIGAVDKLNGKRVAVEITLEPKRRRYFDPMVWVPFSVAFQHYEVHDGEDDAG